jgi:hypothetical protein
VIGAIASSDDGPARSGKSVEHERRPEQPAKLAEAISPVLASLSLSDAGVAGKLGVWAKRPMPNEEAKASVTPGGST